MYLLVTDLKFVGVLKMRFVVLMLPRTNCHHCNAISYGPRNAVLKIFSSKVEDYIFPILSTRDIEKHQFLGAFSP